jgi:hypothetical protein
MGSAAKGPHIKLIRCPIWIEFGTNFGTLWDHSGPIMGPTVGPLTGLFLGSIMDLQQLWTEHGSLDRTYRAFIRHSFMYLLSSTTVLARVDGIMLPLPFFRNAYRDKESQ